MNKLNFSGSWKTTTAGLAAVLAVVADTLAKLTDNDSMTNPDWNLVVAFIASAAIGLFARDNDKSSESVGATVTTATVVTPPKS